ncbi:MAG: HEPN domain-containing protein [Clostridia bacterium]|nr:HEPN domain-containing protein [Clostridia bacterium]
MQVDDKKALSAARMEHAEECLEAAENLIKTCNYKSAANRSYYAVFHAMRAVLAFDGIDMKHHSGVMSEFRRLYIKTGIFDADMSQIISLLFNVRTDSDYDDFYVVSREETSEQFKNAKHFLREIENYLKTK